MTEIPIGYVGVVISFVGIDGPDISGVEFKHGNIVARGNKVFLGCVPGAIRRRQNGAIDFPAGRLRQCFE